GAVSHRHIAVGQRIALTIEREIQPAQRRETHQRHRRDSGRAGDAFHHLLGEGVFVLRREPERYHHQSLRVVAWINSEQSREAVDEQSGADQQRQRQRNLSDYQPLSRALMASAGAAAATLFQRLVDIRLCRLPAWRQTEDQSRQDRNGQREEQRDAVNANLTAQFGERLKSEIELGQQPRQRLNAPDRQQHPQRAAEQAEQQALRQQLPDHHPPRRAERQPDGHLPAPRRRAREQQVGHVRARDQQHESDSAHQYQQRLPAVLRQ